MIRVIGIGSPFGDDRVGWYVVELLRGRVSDTIELLALDRPGAALINWMHGVDWFILIDASGPQDLPGKVQHVDPDRLALPGQAFTSHHLDLAQTLRLADALGCRPQRVDVYAVEMQDLRPGNISDAAVAGAEQLASELIRTLHPLTEIRSAKAHIHRECRHPGIDIAK